MAKANKRTTTAHPLEKTHAGHAMHMCDLAAKRKMDQIADLAAGAKYICHLCGRAAASPENLCEAVEI